MFLVYVKGNAFVYNKNLQFELNKYEHAIMVLIARWSLFIIQFIRFKLSKRAEYIALSANYSDDQ